MSEEPKRDRVVITSGETTLCVSGLSATPTHPPGPPMDWGRSEKQERVELFLRRNLV